jgi:hypothetical protein
VLRIGGPREQVAMNASRLERGRLFVTVSRFLSFPTHLWSLSSNSRSLQLAKGYGSAVTHMLLV